jgi:hypothetical protein
MDPHPTPTSYDWGAGPSGVVLREQLDGGQELARMVCHEVQRPALTKCQDRLDVGREGQTYGKRGEGAESRVDRHGAGLGFAAVGLREFVDDGRDANAWVGKLAIV